MPALRTGLILQISLKTEPCKVFQARSSFQALRQQITRLVRAAAHQKDRVVSAHPGKSEECKGNTWKRLPLSKMINRWG